MMVVTEIKEHTEVFVISINQQDLVPEQLRKTRQEWFCVYVTHSVVGRNGKFMTGEYFKVKRQLSILISISSTQLDIGLSTETKCL